MIDPEIRATVEDTAFIDTHEHFIEEKTRLAGAVEPRLFPCDDWSVLLDQYVADDLASSGMPDVSLLKLRDPDVGAADKFDLLAPWWERTKHTGYASAVRITIGRLYGEDDLTRESVPRLAEKYRELVRPGFYGRVLRETAHLESCQVNSLEKIFMETDQPELLPQDLSFAEFARCNSSDIEMLEKETDRQVSSLEDWLAIIDVYFDRYGPRAVAVKNRNAYQRRLNYEAVSQDRAARIFREMRSPYQIGTDDLKSLQDFLFRYCLKKATEFALPVKLHTGFYSGRSLMPLSRLQQNASDLCQLLQDFPTTKFVLMHIGYPYQDEFIALAKHYQNAYVDMCWAWIINPIASMRFLKEFLLAAPANKILTFGGDYIIAENVVGHAAIARRGISQVLSELVAEGWIKRAEVRDLVTRIMATNARELFPDRTPKK